MANLLTQAIQAADADTACKLLQDALGIDTGDIASHYLSGYLWEEADFDGKSRIISLWLAAECAYATPEPRR